MALLCTKVDKELKMFQTETKSYLLSEENVAYIFVNFIISALQNSLQTKLNFHSSISHSQFVLGDPFLSKKENGSN